MTTLLGLSLALLLALPLPQAFQQALQASQAGRMAEALPLWNAVIADAPEEAAAWSNRGNVRLALGDPPHEILKTASEEGCDLIAMTTHGHRLFADLFFGSTIEHVRHRATVPLLVVRASEQ